MTRKARNTVTCHCGTTAELKDDSSNMRSYTNIGWGIVPTFKGEILKKCPECYARLTALALEINAITDNPYISLSHLIKNAQPPS